MLLALLAGCECNGNHGLIVDLRSNFVPGIEFDAVRTEIWGSDNRSPEVATDTVVRWTDPVREGVRIAEAPVLAEGRYTVSATLLRAGSVIAQRSVIVTFETSLVITMLVTRDCFNVICPDPLTCLVGVCVPQDCLDGSTFDGCPAVTCSGDDMCPPFPIECTDALCLEGRCYPFPDHEECGEAEWCNPDEGCRILPDRPGPDDAGPPRPGEDAGPPGDGGGIDAGPPPGPCVPGGCDDGNPCTDDVCEAMGCVFEPNREICNDGRFCNGPDTCSGGRCSVSSGDPCPGASTCNELLDTCEGCATDADCPDDLPSPWGACGFGETCASTGTRSRTITSYACAAGVCGGSIMPDSGSCSRASRDGVSCGSTSCGGWGSCDYTGTCDESASQSRTCTDRVCAGGACADSSYGESRGCSRSRAGTTCGAGSYCDRWGSCNYSGECDESASQMRTCHDFACGGGSCSDSPSSESRGCSRSTEDDRCGSNPTYCGRRTRCRVCRSGSCVINTPHFNAACNPSCGMAITLCGGPGACCASTGSCTPLGGGPFADCTQCCEGGVCF